MQNSFDRKCWQITSKLFWAILQSIWISTGYSAISEQPWPSGLSNGSLRLLGNNSDAWILWQLKKIAAKFGLRFHRFKPTGIRLLVWIISSGTGSRVELSYLDLLSRLSSIGLVSSAVQSALVYPSFDMAVRTRQSYDIQLNVKTTQRFCLDKAMQKRIYSNLIVAGYVLCH